MQILVLTVLEELSYIAVDYQTMKVLLYYRNQDQCRVEATIAGNLPKTDQYA